MIIIPDAAADLSYIEETISSALQAPSAATQPQFETVVMPPITSTAEPMSDALAPAISTLPLAAAEAPAAAAPAIFAITAQLFGTASYAPSLALKYFDFCTIL